MSSWKELQSLAAVAKRRRIATLFSDPTRAETFAVEFDDPQVGRLRLDYSRTNLDHNQRAALLRLCETAELAARRQAMVSGQRINVTEDRAVLHMALRMLEGSVLVDGTDVIPEVRATLQRMESFARDLRDGRVRGAGGRITDVVHIGIGGSDLGPRLGVAALSPYADGPRVLFVSNVDPADISDTLAPLDPRTTLVIVVSKTFTTLETLTNARVAQEWMTRALGEPTRQFVAVTAARDQARAFGIDPSRVFAFADWVGGRYSVWGPVGLSLMIAVGPEHFRAFLAGAAAMDRHFLSAPFDANMPVMLALIGLWHRQVLGYPTRAVVPYERRLALLPAYLQQLEMESNGKSVRSDGSPVERPTAPVVWGAPGTDAQHAFFQFLHQGTDIVPVEFLVGAQGHEPQLAEQHRLLVANCLAQAEALMSGRAPEIVRARLAEQGLPEEQRALLEAHRSFAGNRPSTLLIYPKLTPAVLGALLALYEHRVFVEGVVLGINSFDQWGVELGKEMAQALTPLLGDETQTPQDPATAAAVRLIRALGG